MKKRLLTLGAIVMYLSHNAQNVVTYVGNNAKIYVSNNALVYSGGVWKVDSEMEKSVENKGNIVIVDNYVKGNGTYGEDGREFVNIYTGDNDYGQVKILSATAPATGRMTLEKPVAPAVYFGVEYPIGIPFVDNVKYMMHSFGMEEIDFKGDCGIDVNCGNKRYEMTMMKWNNDRLHYDAVPVNGYNFKYGHYYALNLRKKEMQDKMAKSTYISYKGMPSGESYSQTARGVISGLLEQDFSNLGYNSWKRKRNSYNEYYESYLGNLDTDSKVYNKNVYRFANPYTSNIDLSAVDGNNAWLKIRNNGGNRNIKSAYDDRLIRKFSVRKRAKDYDIDWNAAKGGTNVRASYHIAEFDGTKWTGSAEALLIRPMETFNLDFASLNPTNLGGTRVLDVEVSFNDNHKTFAHSAGNPTLTSSMNTSPTTLSTFSVEDNNARLVLADENIDNSEHNFYQLELFLAENNIIQSTPAYIVGSNYYKETGSNSPNTNRIYAYGVKEDNISYESKKGINEFNSLTYIAKPLGIGFNDLELGKEYKLGFNLYEKSIFNRVKDLTDGAFFLKDNLLDRIVKIDTKNIYTFIADENVNERFVVYWKEVPKSTSIIDVVDTPTEISHKTIVYKDNNVNKVRFEGDKETAKVEVYNAAGRLISLKEGLSVNTDYTLNLSAKGMYIIKVIYKNQDVRVLKLINN